MGLRKFNLSNGLVSHWEIVDYMQDYDAGLLRAAENGHLNLVQFYLKDTPADPSHEVTI